MVTHGAEVPHDGGIDPHIFCEAESQTLKGHERRVVQRCRYEYAYPQHHIGASKTTYGSVFLIQSLTALKGLSTG